MDIADLCCSGGGIDKSLKSATTHLTFTNDPELVLPLICLWGFIFLTLWEQVREIIIIRRMMRKMSITASSVIGAEVQLKTKDFALHYLSHRGFIATIKASKLVFALSILFRLLRYPIAGPKDLLSASRQANAAVPESTTLLHNLEVFVVRHLAVH